MDTLVKIRKTVRNLSDIKLSEKGISGKIDIEISNSVTSNTQSWKCCKCKTENYNNKWKCSWCAHDRCNSCINLLG
jgi:hypothetical protein